MILRSKGSLTFHSDVARQHHKRGYRNSDPSKFPILNPYTDRLEPFTFHKTITGENITEILLIDQKGNETDLTTDSGFTDLKTITEYAKEYDEVRYDGDELDTTLPEGLHYLKLTTASEVFYSNYFLIEA